MSVLVGSLVGWRGALLVTGGVALVVTLLLVAVAPTVPADTSRGPGALRQALAPPRPRDAGAGPRPVRGVRLADGVPRAGARASDRRLRGRGQRGPRRLRTGQPRRLIARRAARGHRRRARSRDRHARARGRGRLAVPGARRTRARRRRDPGLGGGRLQRAAVGPVPGREPRRAGAAALVASLPASAASAGIALGSTASGVSYTAAGPTAVVLTSMVLALGALAVALATRRLQPGVSPAPPASYGRAAAAPVSCLAAWLPEPRRTPTASGVRGSASREAGLPDGPPLRADRDLDRQHR